MRRASLVVVLVLGGCGGVPCAQPLEAFCRGDCPAYDALVSPTASVDAGCGTASLMVCEGRRALSFPGYTATRMFFDDDGKLLGLSQATDVTFECGEATRSYGQTFECGSAAEERVCRATR